MDGYEKRLAALAFAVQMGKRKDDPLDEQSTFRRLYHATVNLTALKKAKANHENLYALLEFYSLIYGAVDIAKEYTVESGTGALEKHGKRLFKAAEVMVQMLRMLDESGRAVATGDQLRTLDIGYEAAVGVLHAVPEWTIHESAYLMLKTDYERSKGRRTGGKKAGRKSKKGKRK